MLFGDLEIVGVKDKGVYCLGETTLICLESLIVIDLDGAYCPVRRALCALYRHGPRFVSDYLVWVDR